MKKTPRIRKARKKMQAKQRLRAKKERKGNKTKMKINRFINFNPQKLFRNSTTFTKTTMKYGQIETNQKTMNNVTM